MYWWGWLVAPVLMVHYTGSVMLAALTQINSWATNRWAGASRKGNRIFPRWRPGPRPIPIICNPLLFHNPPPLKGHGNEGDFLVFLHKSVWHRSFTVHFGFKFEEIYVIEKRLPDSPSRGVDKNAYRYKFFQAFK
jgi:hypothetical protein